MSLLTDELQTWIGRQVSYLAPEPIGRASIRYFAAAVGDQDPTYRDDSYARAAGHPSVIAPPTLVCETCQYTDLPPNDDGYAGHQWDLPIADCRIIRAGNDYEFQQAVVATDVLSVTWTLDSIEERSSSAGGIQLFVVSTARYVNQHGELLATNRETMVYQPL